MKYLIVGLGNIGAEYENTRHNSGFMVVNQLAKEEAASWTIERHAYRTEIRHKGRTLILIKPTTYMNLSGKAVKYWMTAEKIALENVLVIVDDIALPIGTLRMKKQGSGGGHNGLGNIEEILNTNAYCRLRIGVGNNFSRGHQIDYVLGQFTAEEQVLLNPQIDRAIEIIKSFATVGPDRTMNLFN
ncbi:MAG: aminoacyl-tRNA hydrolase [Bacteroidales bacterium]|nr:aminoacyl-tRNA hydrolase [Candidatus Colimorpha onthohippi]